MLHAKMKLLKAFMDKHKHENMNRRERTFMSYNVVEVVSFTCDVLNVLMLHKSPKTFTGHTSTIGDKITQKQGKKRKILY